MFQFPVCGFPFGGGGPARPGAGGAGAAPPPPPEWCEGETRFEYAPEKGDWLAAFPDDYWTAPDDDSPTGRRPAIPEDVQWIKDVPGRYGESYL